MRKILILGTLLLALMAGCSPRSADGLDGVEVLDLTANGKHLLFYGSRHSNDKNDAMFADIEQRFASLNPQLVLVEGYYDSRSFQTAEEAITFGESAFVSFLAKGGNLPVGTVEPSMKEQYAGLLEKFNKEKVYAMYLLRQLDQYQSEQKEKPRMIQDLLQNYALDMKEEGFAIDETETKFDYLADLLAPYAGVKPDESNWLTVDAYSLVHGAGSELNAIYKEVYAARNEYLLSKIKESLREYDRVFVVMGSQHVIDERKNIQKLFREAAQ